MTKALIAEAIGTFALTFIGAGAGALGVGGLVGVAFAHGLVVLAFAYAYGHHSGAHINPAVTFGLWVAGEIQAGRAVAYWIAQAIGGILAGVALVIVLGSGEAVKPGATVLAANVTAGQGLLLEAILTFFLANTVLNTAVSGKGGPLSGVAIGMTLTLSILMGGPLTGASLNPARTLGPALFTGTVNQFWIYLVGTFIGGAVAGLLYRGVFKEK